MLPSFLCQEGETLTEKISSHSDILVDFAHSPLHISSNRENLLSFPRSRFRKDLLVLLHASASFIRSLVSICFTLTCQTVMLLPAKCKLFSLLLLLMNISFSLLFCLDPGLTKINPMTERLIRVDIKIQLADIPQQVIMSKSVRLVYHLGLNGYLRAACNVRVDKNYSANY